MLAAVCYEQWVLHAGEAESASHEEYVIVIVFDKQDRWRTDEQCLHEIGGLAEKVRGWD
jgi:hypothetical protein